MEILEILILSIAVAADAFSVALCKGVKIKNQINKKAFKMGKWFGFFQTIMAFIGCVFMEIIDEYVYGVKDIIIFGVLTYIGIAMILEAKKQEKFDDSLKFKEMLGLSLATSLDALSIGTALTMYSMNVLFIVAIIGVVTFILSFLGVKIGNKFGSKYKATAEIIGGIVLILIGIKTIAKY